MELSDHDGFLRIRYALFPVRIPGEGQRQRADPSNEHHQDNHIFLHVVESGSDAHGQANGAECGECFKNIFNKFGSLGIKGANLVFSPVKLEGLPPIVHADCYSRSSFLRDIDGLVWVFGANDKGQLCL